MTSRSLPRDGESRAQDRGDEREDDALGQQLPHEASRTRAECATDGKLALARDASGEHEVGDIAAPDEQDECASREKHEERSAHGSDHHVVERHDVDAAVGVRVGKRLRPPNGDRVELALRSGAATPGFRRAIARRYPQPRHGRSSTGTSRRSH